MILWVILFFVGYFFVNLQVGNELMDSTSLVPALLRKIKHNYIIKNMKKIVALMCVCACLTAMAGVPRVNQAFPTIQPSVDRMMSNAVSPKSTFGISLGQMSGNRICFLHPYEVVEGANGTKQAQPYDPFNIGGWTVNLVNDEEEGYLTIEGGMIINNVSMPVKVDYNINRVTLEANNEPFATTTSTQTTTLGAYTTTVDSTVNYYIVNEAWVLNQGDLADVIGRIYSDGSIEIVDGFAYYIETVVTTTITHNGQSRVNTDTMRATSMIYRNTRLMVPNGKHEFTDAQTGRTSIVDVYMYQAGDTVFVMNLYGFGWGENKIELYNDGVAEIPCQPIRDVADVDYPNGDGVWYNTNGSTMGNQGTATPDLISWGLTVPNDNSGAVASGWRNNKLYFTDGKTFTIPGSGLLGDVDENGKVNIADVTALIDPLLAGQLDTINFANSDCNRDGSVTITDVTVLIDYLLTGVWPD